MPTTKMLPFRCATPQCERAGNRKKVWHVSEGTKPVCPNCHSDKAIIPLEVIHLLVPDPNGPYHIHSNDPELSRPLALACELSRSLDEKGRNFHRTTSVLGATCFECLKHYQQQQSAQHKE